MHAPSFSGYFMKDGRPTKRMTDGTEILVFGDTFAILASARDGAPIYHGTARYVEAMKGEYLRHNPGLTALDLIYAAIPVKDLTESDLSDLSFLINSRAGSEAAGILAVRAAARAA